MRHIFGGSRFAVLSAERSELTAAENAERTAALRGVLEALGADWEGVEGYWEGGVEAAFLIRGVSASVVASLATAFGQDAVILGRNGADVTTARLVMLHTGAAYRCTGTADPRAGGSYFTTVKGQRVALRFAVGSTAEVK